MAITNNDIIRRLRYTFDFSDAKMIEIFAAADFKMNRAQISNLMKKESDPEHRECDDPTMAVFLNGFINMRRGKKEGAQPEIEEHLTNNIIFRKLKIALNLTADDVLEIMALGDLTISKHELSAFFRKPTHKHYRQCKDQILRRFLHGMQQKYRPSDHPD